MTDIFFTGFGMISPVGKTAGEVLDSIREGVSRPDSVDVLLQDKVLKIPYRTIDSFSVEGGVGRMKLFVEQAVQQAVDDAGLTQEQLRSTGLFVGSTSFDMFQCEQQIKENALSGDVIAEAIPFFSALTDFIRDTFALTGPSYTFNTACTSSANAVIYAAEFIRRGDIDHAIVVGVEFFNEVTALGFCGLELISQKGMRPFSTERDGLFLGEGCGAVVLSNQANGSVLRYAGGANIGDNFSITASNPDGSVIEETIERALRNADISVEDVVLVKAHGTASLSNDEAEAAGLGGVFSKRNLPTPPIVCFKPYIGHTLGACGVNELILFSKSLKAGFDAPIQEIDEFLKIRFAEASDFDRTGYFLLNYFGFGGNSTVLVLRND